MKKLLLLTAFLVGFAACQREELQEPVTVGFEVSAVPTDETRAGYDSGKHALSWEAGDEIGCYAGISENVKFMNTEEAPTSFKGTLLAKAEKYYFYFPYNKAATAENNVVTSTYPAEQALNVGDFTATPPMAAYSADLDKGVTFHNGCGLLKFTITTDVARTLVRAEFSGNNDEEIAGEYTMDMSSEEPEMKIVSGGATKIAMTGAVNMEAGGSYSFILPLPVTDFEAGVTIKFLASDGKIATYVFDNKLVMARNKSVEIKSKTLDFSEAAEVLDVQSFSVMIDDASVPATVNKDSKTITIAREGFTNPQALKASLVVTGATSVTLEPTVTIGTANHSDDSGVLENPADFTMNLMMPRKLTITYENYSETYTVKFSQLTDTGLPVVYINTATGADVPVDDKDTWIKGSEIYIDAAGKQSFDRAMTYEDFANAECEIKGRGNTTWTWVKNSEELKDENGNLVFPNGAKRPYAIKLEKKGNVLKMGKHKRWVLLNNVADKSMVRNFIAFRTANALATAGSDDWHPTGQLVEVVMNGMHRGNYLLCEQIKLDDESRIKGTEYGDAPLVTGSEISYLLEGDRNWGHSLTGAADETLHWNSWRESSSWAHSTDGTINWLYKEDGVKVYATNYVAAGTADDSYLDGNTYRFRWGLKSPDDGDLEEDGMKESVAYKFISGKVTEVEKFLFSDDFLKASKDDIEQYINLDSFIEYWLVFEIVTNHEPNNPGSCYMHYYDRDGKIYMGPVWDFDYGTFLNDAFTDGYKADGTTPRYDDKNNHFLIANSLWYCRLLQNEAVQKYIIEDRWPLYKGKALSVANDIENLKKYLKNSSEYNFDMWPIQSGFTDPNTEKDMSFEDAISRIQTNMKARIGHLDALIGTKPSNN